MFQITVALSIEPVAQANTSADSPCLFPFCLGSFTFSTISGCVDALPDYNKCKWLFFFLTIFKVLIQKDGNSEKQFAEENIIQWSSYQQVCLRCLQRDVMDSQGILVEEIVYQLIRSGFVHRYSVCVERLQVMFF